MAERLDRFTWVNILYQSFDVNKDSEVARIASLLSELPGGWWISSVHCETAWAILNKTVAYVISAYSQHQCAWKKKFLLWFMTPAANLGVQNQESSILAAHHSAYHVAQYKGEEWKSYIERAYGAAGVCKQWLEDLQTCNAEFWLCSLYKDKYPQ